jgi:ABC-type transporter Mla MlaB component/LysM repeat protein
MNRKLPALWVSILTLAMVAGCLSAAATVAGIGPSPGEKSVSIQADALGGGLGLERTSARERNRAERGHERTSTRERNRAEQTVTVEQGNTLWSITVAMLKTSRAGRIAAYWPLIYRANRAVIGPDPDLIIPGQVLVLPSSDGRPNVRSTPSQSGDRASRPGEGDRGAARSRVGSTKSAKDVQSQDGSAKEVTETAPPTGEKAGAGNGGSAQRSRAELVRHTVEFVVRDALFGLRMGSSIKLRYPNGEVRRFQLGSHGRLEVGGLPEGRYVVGADVAGISSPLSFYLSRGRTVQLSVLTYWDLAAAVLAVCLVLCVLPLGRRLFRGRPRSFRLPRVRERSGAIPIALEIGLRRLVAICRLRLPAKQRWMPRTAETEYVRAHLKDARLIEGWQDRGWRLGKDEHVLVNVVMKWDERGRAVGRPVDVLLRPSSVEVFHRNQISFLERLPAPSCVVSIGQRLGSLKIACAGRLDVQAAAKLAGVLDSCVRTSSRLAHVDCSQVQDVDEAAGGILAHVVAQCERRRVPFNDSPATAAATSAVVGPRGKDRSEPSRIITARSALLPVVPGHSSRRHPAESRSTTPQSGSQDQSPGTHPGRANEGSLLHGRDGGDVVERDETTATPSDSGGRLATSNGAVLSEREDRVDNSGRAATDGAEGVDSLPEVRSH